MLVLSGTRPATLATYSPRHPMLTPLCPWQRVARRWRDRCRQDVAESTCPWFLSLRSPRPAAPQCPPRPSFLIHLKLRCGFCAAPLFVFLPLLFLGSRRSEIH